MPKICNRFEEVTDWIPSSIITKINQFTSQHHFIYCRKLWSMQKRFIFIVEYVMDLFISFYLFIFYKSDLSHSSSCSVYLSLSLSLSECLLSSWALEWQEWAPHKTPEQAGDLKVLIHHDSPTQTHPNTPSTWLIIASFPLDWRNLAKGWLQEIKIKRLCHVVSSTHMHTSLWSNLL